MSSEQTAYIIDDDEAVRDAIGMYLETVGISHALFPLATDFLEAFNDELTGCLVLDVRMPGMTGLELQTALNERESRLPIIFITGHGDVPMAVEAMRAGAFDFIRKPFAEEELVGRINEAFGTEAKDREAHDSETDLLQKLDSLSPREREVFIRVADGQANKFVAIELGISERTVEIHRAQVMRKMGARTLAQLVRMKIALEPTEPDLKPG
jgi:FixJ family two-component response regulator